LKLHRDEAGLVGKVVVIWLVVVAILAVAVLDAVSIAFTTFRLNDTAATAASTAANTYRNVHDVGQACAAARQIALQEDADTIMSKNFCRVDTTSGQVTIVLKKDAKTILAGRLSLTRDYTKVTQRETAGPSAL
jgi:hypothetical protein